VQRTTNGNPVSGRVSDDEDRSRGLLQLRDPNSSPPKKFFHARGPVIAVLEQDHLGRRAAVLGKFEKIRVSRHDDETVGLRVLPNGLVRGKPDEACVEHVCRVGKEFRNATDELGCKIRFKQKLQRETRSRPVCEA
jgi:hypothetical protein